jgi:hypothetical protein
VSRLHDSNINFRVISNQGEKQMRVQNQIICSTDLAGKVYKNPNYLQTRQRINYLVNHFLSQGILYSRLHDLPTQFENPRQRHWQPIDWKAISDEQIVGVPKDLFISFLVNATEIETPIRNYAIESRDYLQAAHPQLARFMGGTFSEDGKMLEIGVWEKEERQHAPVFQKIYHKLTLEKLQPKPNTVQGYQKSDDLQQDIYSHVLSRMATEWSATSSYLWLMAHSTGALQHAIAQPLQDEINHLAKFWGIGIWAFGDSYIARLQGMTQLLIDLLKHHKNERSQEVNIFGFSNALYAVELMFTFSRVMTRLNRWHKSLDAGYLENLFGEKPMLLT